MKTTKDELLRKVATLEAENRSIITADENLRKDFSKIFRSGVTGFYSNSALASSTPITLSWAEIYAKVGGLLATSERSDTELTIIRNNIEELRLKLQEQDKTKIGM